MREYLSVMTPEEVTERLNKGEMVYYTDSKGIEHSYKFINGICVRFTDDEVDGYGRSIYSTGDCYFESFNKDTTSDPTEEKLKKCLSIIIKALKEGL